MKLCKIGLIITIICEKFQAMVVGDPVFPRATFHKICGGGACAPDTPLLVLQLVTISKVVTTQVSQDTGFIMYEIIKNCFPCVLTFTEGCGT